MVEQSQSVGLLYWCALKFGRADIDSHLRASTTLIVTSAQRLSSLAYQFNNGDSVPVRVARWNGRCDCDLMSIRPVDESRRKQPHSPGTQSLQGGGQ